MERGIFSLSPRKDPEQCQAEAKLCFLDWLVHHLKLFQKVLGNKISLYSSKWHCRLTNILYFYLCKIPLEIF